MIAHITPTVRLTIAEFDKFIAEYVGNTIFEYIGGEMVEVPSNPYVSALAAAFSFFIKLFLREHSIEGHVIGEAGLYIVLGERYAPDVAFISKSRQPELARQGANPTAPELAIEIVSNEKSAKEIRPGFSVVLGDVFKNAAAE